MSTVELSRVKWVHTREKMTLLPALLSTSLSPFSSRLREPAGRLVATDRHVFTCMKYMMTYFASLLIIPVIFNISSNLKNPYLILILTYLNFIHFKLRYLLLPFKFLFMSIKIGRAPRLNSSHANISYAVFCLKKKKKKQKTLT